MTYGKDIPAYALQPARAPEIMPAEAIFHTEKIDYPGEVQTTVFQLEEDILVPDTKADMKEILMMEASCDIAPEEKKIMPKSDDLLNFTGMIQLQTLYNPDNDHKEPVSITSKVPYQFQWNFAPAEAGQGLFSVTVKSLEYMMINERKFRVKLSLEVSGQLFCQKEVSFFDGLQAEQLEMKTAEASLCTLAAVKKDEITIEETFPPRETGIRLKEVLTQNFLVMENYRQITTEKIVINGFLFADLLCVVVKEDGGEKELYQHHQRIEFTQFLPIEKELRKKKWSAAKISFDARDLQVSISGHGEDSREETFLMKGNIFARVELYETRTQKAVVDAYHREKNFRCSFYSQPMLESLEQGSAEMTVRELLHLPEGQRAESVVCCRGKMAECTLKEERGKLTAMGVVEFSCLWKNQEGDYRNAKIKHPFSLPLEAEKESFHTSGRCVPYIKQSWATRINEKQIETSCTAILCTELRKESPLKLLQEPVFVQGQKEVSYPMAVVTVKERETLWDLAKKYRTTEERIRKMNRIEKEPATGQKLLIIK